MTSSLARPKDNPWKLKTAPGTSEYKVHTDEKDGKTILVCTVGSTVLHYDARCIEDLLGMLKESGEWIELGGADEQKPAKDGTVESWGRSEANPVGGWYGLKKGLRGRFGVVEFMPGATGVTVRVTFDAEAENSAEQQRQGWQAILNNFARHVEANRDFGQHADKQST